MMHKIILSTYLILTLSVQPLCAQEQQVQSAQTAQKAPEKKSWWTSTKKKIVFGLSTIGAAAVITIGGWQYKRFKTERQKELDEKLLHTYTIEGVKKLLDQGANINTQESMGEGTL